MMLALGAIALALKVVGNRVADFPTGALPQTPRCFATARCAGFVCGKLVRQARVVACSRTRATLGAVRGRGPSLARGGVERSETVLEQLPERLKHKQILAHKCVWRSTC